ncbi:MAG TPA: hypothetical protein VGM91_16460 [Conexibacter sp.]|jgi:hypothetical protein
MSPKRAARTLAAAGATALLLAAAPAALANTSTISGSINPNHGRPGTPLALTVNFTLDPTAGAIPGTLNRVIVQLPPQATDNGAMFPSCTADQVNAAHGNGRLCPKGSKIGIGNIRADVPPIPISNVPATAEFFNGKGGKSITILVHVTNPVTLDVAFDAPIVHTSGRYGYKLTANLPYILQELNGEGGGYFDAVRKFTATINAKIKVRGRTRGYIEAKRCPKSGKAPIAGQFSFLDNTAQEPGVDHSSTSATGTITCKP